MPRFSDELLQLPEDAGELAHQAFSVGIQEGLIVSSQSRHTAVMDVALRLPVHSLEFLTSQSPGWQLRGQQDPLTIPPVAIACGVCYDTEIKRREFRETLRGEERDKVKLPMYSPWFWSWASFSRHLPSHPPESWGPLGERELMWGGLWSLASGEAAPPGFYERRALLGVPKQIPADFVQRVAPICDSPPLPVLHFATLPRKLGNILISQCADKSTEEPYSMEALGFMIASRHQKLLEESRLAQLGEEMRARRSWVQQRVLGLESFSPSSFPAGMVGRRPGDWMWPLIDALLSTGVLNNWPTASAAEKRAILLTLERGWLKGELMVRPELLSCHGGKCTNREHEHRALPFKPHPDLLRTIALSHEEVLARTHQMFDEQPEEEVDRRELELEESVAVLHELNGLVPLADEGANGDLQHRPAEEAGAEREGDEEEDEPEALENGYLNDDPAEEDQEDFDDGSESGAQLVGDAAPAGGAEEEGRLGGTPRSAGSSLNEDHVPYAWAGEGEEPGAYFDFPLAASPAVDIPAGRLQLRAGGQSLAPGLPRWQPTQQDPLLRTGVNLQRANNVLGRRNSARASPVVREGAESRERLTMSTRSKRQRPSFSPSPTSPALPVVVRAGLAPSTSVQPGLPAVVLQPRPVLPAPALAPPAAGTAPPAAVLPRPPAPPRPSSVPGRGRAAVRGAAPAGVSRSYSRQGRNSGPRGSKKK